jgi:putative methyltransferase (TIGR04325 family)
VLRALLKDLLPPVATRAAARLLAGRSGFRGAFSSWEEARRASTGYDTEVILERVAEATVKVDRGEAAYERDSVLFDKVQLAWPLLAGLLWAASRSGDRLRVLDFGGALGSSYRQNRRFLAHLHDLRWQVVDQEPFVRKGRELFSDSVLTFHEEPEQCLVDGGPEVLLLSSVIQYLERPYDMLERLLVLGCPFAIVDRTSFLADGEDRLTVQRVSADVYPASYPCWFLNLSRFRSVIGKYYEIVAEFDGFDRADVPGSTYKGFVLERK